MSSSSSSNSGAAAAAKPAASTRDYVFIEGETGRAYAILYGFCVHEFKGPQSWPMRAKDDPAAAPPPSNERTDFTHFVKETPFYIGRAKSSDDGSASADVEGFNITRENMLSFPNQTILSKVHAEINWDEGAGRYYVRALGKSGVDVNASHTDSSPRPTSDYSEKDCAYLSSGDAVRVGPVFFYFQLPKPLPKAERTPAKGAGSSEAAVGDERVAGKKRKAPSAVAGGASAPPPSSGEAAASAASAAEGAASAPTPRRPKTDTKKTFHSVSGSTRTSFERPSSYRPHSCGGTS